MYLTVTMIGNNFKILGIKKVLQLVFDVPILFFFFALPGFYLVKCDFLKKLTVCLVKSKNYTCFFFPGKGKKKK